MTPVDWRTEKPFRKGSETLSVDPVLHVRRVPLHNHYLVGHHELSASLNDRKVEGQRHVCAHNVV